MLHTFGLSQSEKLDTFKVSFLTRLSHMMFILFVAVDGKDLAISHNFCVL